MRVNNFFKLIIAIGVSLSAGAIGAIFTAPAIPTWYADLVKPALNPPAWIFGPVWTTLYVLMGIAAFLVWSSYPKASEDKKKQIKIALGVFGAQLFLNAAWSITFFGFQNPGWALVDIILLWLAIVWTMVVFYQISKPAAYLLVPYLLWVSFASYLNYSIWVLNY
jgi:tryptophan-rich sensory protein